MSVWKKIPIPPAGVMPGGLVTKIGIAATSLLLAAMLLTYTFTGGGERRMLRSRFPRPRTSAFNRGPRPRSRPRRAGKPPSSGYRPMRPNAS